MIAPAYSTQHSSTAGFGPVNQIPTESDEIQGVFQQGLPRSRTAFGKKGK